MSLQPRRGSHLIMAMPDLHIPYHDPQALRVFLRVHEMLKPQRTVILGDMIDCGRFSGHTNQSRAEEVAGSFKTREIEPARRILERLEASTERLDYLEGNHEAFVERLAAREPGSAWGDVADLVSPRVLLSEGRQSEFTWTPYHQEDDRIPHVQLAGDLIATHGWSFCRHAARKHVELARAWSVVYGHTHRAQSDTVKDPVTGRVLTGWSSGCMCRLQPLYRCHTPTDWSQGFDLIWARDDGASWTRYSVAIQRGRCILPDGQKICAGTVGSDL